MIKLAIFIYFYIFEYFIFLWINSIFRPITLPVLSISFNIANGIHRVETQECRLPSALLFHPQWLYSCSPAFQSCFRFVGELHSEHIFITFRTCWIFFLLAEKIEFRNLNQNFDIAIKNVELQFCLVVDQALHRTSKLFFSWFTVRHSS